MSSLNPPSYSKVVIGLDPHPGSHTAAALDQQGRSLAHLTINNTPAGEMRLLAWAAQFPKHRWAIEGVGNRFVSKLATTLLAQGESGANIPPALTAQYRSRRGRRKTNLVDAENAARALMANPELSTYRPGPHQSELRELSRSHHRLATELKANRMALVESTVAEVRLALEAVIAALEGALKALRREMEALVGELAPRLLDLFGVGPVIAATLLAEVGDINRFGNRDHFAIYGGCAPVVRASGSQRAVRVNAAGNRRVNWALHMVLLVRGQRDERTQQYLDKKLAEGKTRREAFRCLKTHLAREIYRTLKSPMKTAPHPQVSLPPPLGPCS
jgi:transposase